MINLIKKHLNNQGGTVHLFLLIAVVGLLSFFAISQTASFNSSLFSGLFPKPASFAASSAPQTVKLYAQSGDGLVGYFGSLFSGCTQATWNTARSASSAIADSTSQHRTYFVGSGCVGNYAISLGRGFLAFNTAQIPSNATITSAKIGLYLTGKLNHKNDGKDFISVVQGQQVSNTSLQTTDYPKLGITEGSNRLDITTIPINAFSTWTLNSSGFSWINKGGVTKLALREGHDILNTWAGFTNGQANSIDAVMSEYTGTAGDPYLEVTYTYPLPSATAASTPTPNLSPTPNPSSMGVNVKTFGALGNGINDDAPKIQAALNSLPSNGGTIYIPAGIYMLGTSAGGVEQYPNGSPIQSALIINKPNVIIQGDGTNSILKLMASKKMRIISVTSQNATIQKFAADGNKAQRNGTVAWPGGDLVDALIYGSSTSSSMSVKNCEVKNGVEDGIGFWQSSNSTVDTCTSHDNGTPQAGGMGVAIAGSSNTGGKVLNSSFYNNSAGVWLGFGSSNALVQNNTIQNNTGSAIAVGGDSLQTTTLSTGHQILNNLISGNGISGFNAVDLISSQNGTVSNNTIIDNYYCGLIFSDNGTIPSSNWTVNGNTCSNTNSQRLQDMGIRVLGLSSGINLTGNICENNGTSLEHQIQVINSSAVNSNWQSVNTRNYTP